MSKKVTLDNDKYILGGGMGSWAKSYESATINKGDVRLIGRVLMYAYTIYNSWKDGQEVTWCPVDEKFNTPDNLRNWMNNL